MNILKNDLVAVCESVSNNFIYNKRKKLIIIFLTLFVSRRIVIKNRYYLLLLYKILDKAKNTY